MLLNVCCGARILAGYTNIDIAPTGDHVPNILCDAKAIPLDDGVADELMVIHGWEHLARWECDAYIIEWRRLLKPGGRLILELPDLIKCCENILNGFKGAKHPDQMGMFGLYGDPRPENPFMLHKWAWSPKTLRAYLKEHEFIEIVDAETQFHPVGRARRDMRIEARKRRSE